jgi:methylamine utilization protein MauE
MTGHLSAVVTLALAALWVLAGVSKLRRQTDFRLTLLDFEVSPLLVQPIGIIIPLFEIVLGATIVIPQFIRLSAWAMLGTLTVFSVAVLQALIRGRTPQCHCFGQLSASPITWKTLLRNAGIAIAVFWIATRAPMPSMAHFGASIVRNLSVSPLALIVVIVLTAYAYAILNLMRQNGALLVEVSRLAAALHGGFISDDSIRHGKGTALPDVTLTDSRGRGPVMTNEVIGKFALLVFVSPHCENCRAVVASISKWRKETGSILRIQIIASGSPAANAIAFPDVLPEVLIQESVELASAVGCARTPCAVLVREGVVDGVPVYGPEEILAVARTANKLVSPVA